MITRLLVPTKRIILISCLLEKIVILIVLAIKNAVTNGIISEEIAKRTNNKALELACIVVEQKDYAKANTNIQKAERIIGEFQATLNFKYAVAKDFDNVYRYLMERLIQANMKKDTEILEEVLKHLRTMRDTWKEVMHLTKNGTDVA